MSEYSELVDRITNGIRELNRLIYARMDAAETFGNAPNAARFLFDIRQADDAVEEVTKMTRSLHKLVKEAKAPEAFDLDGVQNVTLLGHRFSRTSNVRAGYREGMKFEALAWLRSNELGDIITEIMPPQSLAATAKGLREENRDLPDDIFNVYHQPGISITKVKP